MNTVPGPAGLNRQEMLFEGHLLQIIDQLGWIRLHLTVFLLLVFLAIVLFVLLIRQIRREVQHADFSKRAQSLLNQEKYDELIRSGKRRVGQFPGDANTHWLLAQAYMRLGQPNESLLHARIVQRLQPDWEEGYTRSFVAYVESTLQAQKEKPEHLKVVTPNFPPQQDVPPPGGTPVS